MISTLGMGMRFKEFELISLNLREFRTVNRYVAQLIAHIALDTDPREIPLLHNFTLYFQENAQFFWEFICSQHEIMLIKSDCIRKVLATRTHFPGFSREKGALSHKIISPKFLDMCLCLLMHQYDIAFLYVEK